MLEERVKNLEKKLAWLKERQPQRDKDIAFAKEEKDKLKQHGASPALIQNASYAHMIAIDLKRQEASRIKEIEKELKDITEPVRQMAEAKAKKEAEQKQRNELTTQMAPLINALSKELHTVEDVEAALDAIRKVDQLSPELIDVFQHAAMCYGGMRVVSDALARAEEFVTCTKDTALRMRVRRLIGEKLAKN